MEAFIIRNVISKRPVIFRRLKSSSIKVPITLNQGTVLGTQSTLPNGNTYFSFKGIPYAVPPIGNLRFKSPVPLEKFHQKTIDCSKEGGVCLQKDPFTGKIIGGEDCLFLNVYTPKLNSGKPLPVMVWVHGGAFVMGSGNSDFYLPLYLMQEDIVIVTLNYRLGIFGFLHLPDGDIHGNAGLRDQMSSSIKVPITVNQGTVLGTQSSLPNGNAYFSFKGIPYAVPPIGNLRFKPPVPLEKFHQETIDCSKEGGVSFQKDPFTGEIIGGENCLFLNVYTPKLNSGKPLPVMVWVHGGAFVMGSGNSDFHLPLYLMQEDVVIVTLNYRLGIFGFLYLPEGDIHGNAGLRDQLLALKWVNKNITKFNGDPSNITLFGQSAGAASVHLHTMFPESKKYFHKAIIQSGNAVMEWVIQKDPLYKARKLAELMGSKAKTDKEIGEFLRNEKDPLKLFMHFLNVLTADERRRGLPMAFKPAIESGSSDAIISKAPLETLLQPNTIEIPVMMGYTSMEGITMLPTALKKLEELDKDLARLIPRSINIEPDDPKCQKIAEEIRQFYFKGQKLSKKFINELVDLLSDYHFIIGSNVAAEIHSRRQHKSQLYFYRFSFDGELNLFKILFNLQKLKGACHGDELFYLFQMSARDEPLRPGTREEKMVKQMSRMWANFAKYGNPTPPDDQSLDVKWESVKKIGDKDEFILDYLEIDENSRMERNPGKERIDFWRKVFKTWNDSFTKPKL